MTGDVAAAFDVSVIVPVFNNASTLEELTERLLSSFGEVGYRAEILLVDDASSDASWETIRGLARSHPDVRGIRLSRNVGQITVIAGASQLCSATTLSCIDADLDLDPAQLPELVRAVEDGADLCSGVRAVRVRGSVLRRVASFILRQTLRASIRAQPSDFGCGMKAFSADLARQTARVRGCDRGYGWALEAHRRAGSFVEIPVRASRPGHSAYRPATRAAIAVEVLISAVLRPARVLSVGGAVVTAASLGAAGYLAWAVPNEGAIAVPAALAALTAALGLLTMLCGFLMREVERAVSLVPPMPVAETC